jgi:hypothetical protein
MGKLRFNKAKKFLRREYRQSLQIFALAAHYKDEHQSENTAPRLATINGLISSRDKYALILVNNFN